MNPETSIPRNSPFWTIFTIGSFVLAAGMMAGGI
jgi:hypothetical protein